MMGIILPTASLLAAGMTILTGSAAAGQVARPPASVERDGVVGPAFHISDLGRSLQFYQDALGMRVTMQFDAKGAALDVAARRQQGRLAEGAPNSVLSFSDDPAAPVIMLLPDAEPHRIEHGHGYARVALRMANLPAVLARLKAAGYATSEVRDAHGTHHVAFTTDPDGYAVELVERI